METQKTRSADDQDVAISQVNETPVENLTRLDLPSNPSVNSYNSLPNSNTSFMPVAKSTSDVDKSDREARRSRKKLNKNQSDLSIDIKKSNFNGISYSNVVPERPTSSQTVLERLKDNVAASKAAKLVPALDATDISRNEPNIIDTKDKDIMQSGIVGLQTVTSPESTRVPESGADSTTEMSKKQRKSSKKKKSRASTPSQPAETFVEPERQTLMSPESLDLLQSGSESTTDISTRKKSSRKKKDSIDADPKVRKKKSLRSPEYYAALEKQLDILATDESPATMTPGLLNTPQTPKKSISRPTVESPRKSPKKKPAEKDQSSLTEIPTMFAEIRKTLQDFKDMIFSIHIDKSDSLDSNLYLQHPLVKISLVDQDTGHYLSKSSKSRKVTFAHDPDTISYIMPVITKPFSLNDNKTKAPVWDEELVLNELYLHILKPKTLVFFEIIDFVTNIKALEVFPSGWNKIAWGFLRLIGADGLATTESRARLQLYKYPRMLPKVPPGIPEVFYCWKRRWEKYPSTLYVKLGAYKPLDMVKVTARPFLPNQIESGRNVAQRQDSARDLEEYLSTTTRPKWRRSPDEQCKLPNKLLYRIDTGQKGSFSCAFSNAGFHIAVASVTLNSYPIKVYQIETGERVATLEGHLDLVYQLNWFKDDSLIISASSDGSVRIWTFMGTSIWESRQLLHPSFVYTAIFHPVATNPRIIATGSFDGAIRFWNVTNEMARQNNIPDKKIDAHKSNINSICYNADGSRLFSGDASGLVKIWSCEGFELDCLKTIDSLYGHPIQALRLHPSNKKVIIQTLGPGLHMLDTRIFRILTHFELPERRSEILKLNGTPALGLKKLNSINQISHARFLKPTFSACGTFIFVGSVDGTVHFWKSESGVYLGSFNSLVLKSWIEDNPVVDISFHPHDHLIAFSLWGDKEPLRVYTWDEDSPSIRLNNGGKGSTDALLSSTPLRKATNTP